MTLEIPIGPPRLALHQGHCVLVTERNGQISWPSDKGLYFYDTRLISSWRLYANGEPWDLVNSASIFHYAARIFLLNRSMLAEGGNIAARTLGLVLSRSISGGMHEDIDITNYGGTPARFNLEIAIRSDFADLFEAKSRHQVPRGRAVSIWSQEGLLLKTSYRNHDFYREIAITSAQSGSPPVYVNGRITFAIDLPPGAAWHTCLLYALTVGQECLEAPAECIADCEKSEAGQRLKLWQHSVLKIRTENQAFHQTYRQAIDDMAALRLPITRGDRRQFLLAAGVPWFVALFGRDSLIASLQNAIVYPEFACGALEALGSLQATVQDDRRDAEPGKILHELRLGELAHFKLIPHTPYYGTADATILYLIVLHTAWRCIGQTDLLRRHMKTAEACLDWIDHYGDRDEDGFQEYEKRSAKGYENQGWKDAGDALVYPDGSLVSGPKAVCELQGYVYDAWLRMAEIFEALGESDRADTLRQKARVLFQRFNDAFWDETAGFYAYALDGAKRKVMSVASNPGHCLWSGIVPPERAERVVRRLMEPDMWSGWGIRTLSADHPAYNPHSYQNGSVWPHDNAIIALGFRRYGFSEEAARIVHGVTGAASLFTLHQMPELYSGISRELAGFPVQYLGANAPQAWAAGSVFAFVQSMLGFQPHAPHERLYLDPILPSWLPDLTLIDMKVGAQKFDIRFWRQDEKTHWKVLKGNPDAALYRSFASATELARTCPPPISRGTESRDDRSENR